MNVAILLVALLGQVQREPVVYDLEGGPPRQVLVDLGDIAVRIWTKPVAAPGPKPPAPTPGPTPPSPTPGPTPPAPEPEWGPLERVLILYETSKATTREPFYSLDFVRGVSQVVPVVDGEPGYRCWDWDQPLASNTPKGWLDARAAALAAVDRSKGPHLFAFDTRGRMRPPVPIPEGMTVDQLLAEIKTLKP